MAQRSIDGTPLPRRELVERRGQHRFPGGGIDRRQGGRRGQRHVALRVAEQIEQNRLTDFKSGGGQHADHALALRCVRAAQIGPPVVGRQHEMIIEIRGRVPIVNLQRQRADRGRINPSAHTAPLSPTHAVIQPVGRPAPKLVFFAAFGRLVTVLQGKDGIPQVGVPAIPMVTAHLKGRHRAIVPVILAVQMRAVLSAQQRGRGQLCEHQCLLGPQERRVLSPTEDDLRHQRAGRHRGAITMHRPHTGLVQFESAARIRVPHLPVTLRRAGKVHRRARQRSRRNRDARGAARLKRLNHPGGDRSVVASTAGRGQVVPSAKFLLAVDNPQHGQTQRLHETFVARHGVAFGQRQRRERVVVAGHAVRNREAAVKLLHAQQCGHGILNGPLIGAGCGRVARAQKRQRCQSGDAGAKRVLRARDSRTPALVSWRTLSDEIDAIP